MKFPTKPPPNALSLLYSWSTTREVTIEPVMMSPTIAHSRWCLS